MARPSAFRPLIDRLAAHGGDTLTLTLAQIEAAIDAVLPPSAGMHRNYWREPVYRHVAELDRAGWRARLNVKERTVTFTRVA